MKNPDAWFGKRIDKIYLYLFQVLSLSSFKLIYAILSKLLFLANILIQYMFL